MRGTYNPDACRLRYASAPVQLSMLGGAALGVALLMALIVHAVAKVFPQLAMYFLPVVVTICVVGTVTLCAAVGCHILMPDTWRIQGQIKRALFSPEYGDPLRLKAGELLPSVQVTCRGKGLYTVVLTSQTSTMEELRDLASHLSSALTGRFANYAVTCAIGDPAARFVAFNVEDVTVDKRHHFKSVEEMRPKKPTLLTIQEGTAIDLSAAGGHILVSGKTRSGKTTGILSLLLQVLLLGPDAYGSQVVIIDPKKAELSRAGAVSLDEDGEARGILAAMRDFADTITKRQAVLNDLSEKTGDAVHWWDASMHPSFLFIDEYVALRAILPAKGSREDPDYCLGTFDGLLKRIVTMGASAGCFAIISIAEASVQEGGLPSMLRSAMSTKILFKPTIPEARLLWSAEKLETMLEGLPYGPGDAWFSSADGTHDEVSVVRFPSLDFPAYAALGKLLGEYYAPKAPQNPGDATPPGEA